MRAAPAAAAAPALLFPSESCAAAKTARRGGQTGAVLESEEPEASHGDRLIVVRETSDARRE